MQLTTAQPAPLFATHDVHGHDVDLSKLKGQKTYLAFERNAGCPVCNLHTHQLLAHAETLQRHGVVVVMIYESTVEKMKEYLGDTIYPFHFVADPQNKLYHLYGVERSMMKVMRGLFHGLMSKVREGTRLFRKPMKQDGHMDRVPAEFVIDDKGKISVAHYGRFVGDHLPVADLLKALLPDR